MTSLFFEQPWMIGAIGTILTIATFYGWMQTGNSIALKVAIGMAVLTLLLLACNAWVVTDAEKIQIWLSDAADELQNNQFERVLKRISPNHSIRVANTAERMKTVKFHVAKVTKIHSIEVDSSGSTPTAFVRMNAFVEAESGGMSGKVPRWVGLTLEKKGNDWLMIDFEDREPQYEFMNSNAQSEMLGQGFQGAR